MRTCFIVLFLAAVPAVSAAPDPLRATPGDVQDLVVFLDARPYLIRLHLQVEGRSFQDSWKETITQLFRYLDANGDGVLSKKEALLAPSNTQWVQMMNGALVEPDAAPDFAVLAGGAAETKVTPERFLSYYQRSGAGALQVEWGWRPPAQDRLTEALFRRLDKNKDNALSREELQSVQEALHPLDLDGDEMIRASELSPFGAYPVFTFRAATDQQPVPKPFPFVILHGDKADGALSEQLLTRYDRNKNRKLSRTELPLEKAAFDRLDADRDGELDASELAGWRKLPPELELIVPLARRGRRDILVLPASGGAAHHLTVRTPPRDGAVRIPLAEKQLEVTRRDGVSGQRQLLLRQFDALAGKSGILGEKNIYQPPFTFVALLRLADRDGDNKLSRKEINDFMDTQEKLFFRVTYLSVIDRGESLFEILDADHDGRLSPREQRMAWQRLSPWDRQGSGRVTRRQMPRQFQLIVSHGRPRAYVPTMANGYGELPLFRDQTRGPLWFRKMDKNDDGDVSSREFLGTSAQFHKIDADGDGLIDVAEAERADQGMRKRR